MPIIIPPEGHPPDQFDPVLMSVIRRYELRVLELEAALAYAEQRAQRHRPAEKKPCGCGRGD